MKTRKPATLDALTYFLKPEDIFHRIQALSGIYNAAGLSSFHVGSSSDNGLKIYCLEYERATLLGLVDASGYRFELFTSTMDSTRDSIASSVFALTRGHDDSTWSIEKTPAVDTADVTTCFEYMTGVFYMDESQIFTLVSDSLIYEGKDVPDDFTTGTVKMFLYPAES